MKSPPRMLLTAAATLWLLFRRARPTPILTGQPS